MQHQNVATHYEGSSSNDGRGPFGALPGCRVLVAGPAGLDGAALGFDVSRSSAFLGERRGQLVYARIGTNPPGDIAKMLVMRQVDYLPNVRHIGE